MILSLENVCFHFVDLMSGDTINVRKDENQWHVFVRPKGFDHTILIATIENKMPATILSAKKVYYTAQKIYNEQRKFKKAR